jgi:predicted Zn-dependent peptidase
MQITGQFEPNEAPESIERIVTELEQLQRQDMTADELRFAKSRARADLLDALSTHASTADWVRAVFENGNVDLAHRHERFLSAVTAESVRAMAARYFHPRDLDIVVFGNAFSLKSKLEALAPVTLYRMTPGADRAGD